VSKKRPLIFSTASYEYLRQAIIACKGFEPGEIERKNFPDGEVYNRITADVKGRDVILLGGTISDSDTMEVYDLGCALVKYGAQSLTLVVPFYGYSTMERAVKSGEVVKAKTRARLLSNIPSAREGNRVLMVDLHAEGIPHYFEGNISTEHIYAKDLVIKAARKLAGGRPFVLASTDAGRAKWVESLANDIGCGAAFAIKRRISGDKTEIVGIAGDVNGVLVILYDDMIRTGGSLIEAASAYKTKGGAAELMVIATHGLFPGNALDRLRNSGLFSRVVCTDSHPRAVSLANDFLEVETIAGLLAKNLKGKAGV
jgi:ribose-phosphate pyrophosphokinase